MSLEADSSPGDSRQEPSLGHNLISACETPGRELSQGFLAFWPTEL